MLATFPVRMVAAPPDLNLPPGTKIRKTLLASTGLVNPAGLAIARDGSFYVSNFGVFPGTNNGQLPGTGQVIHIPRF